MMRRALLALSRSRRLAQFVTNRRLAWLAARRFVSAQALEEALEVVTALNEAGVSATMDLLGEGVTRESEAEASRDRYLETIRGIHGSGVHSGISLKLTSLGLAMSYDLAARLLRDVVERAARFDPPVFVRIDMEASPYVQQTLDMFYDLFEDYRNLGVVIQSYLYRSDEDIERLIEVGAGVRMVKGAYLEPPTIAHADKADVDAAFLRQTVRLMSPEARANGVYAAVATHDVAIIDWTKAHVAENGIPPDAFEFQMLYGLRRDLRSSLVAEGYRMRVYVPYGRQWYAYYMRRVAEDPHNVTWVVRDVLHELIPGR